MQMKNSCVSMLLLITLSIHFMIEVSFGASIPPEYVPEEPIYPFQRYIQVRKSYSVQHLPQPSEQVAQLESATTSDDEAGAAGDYNGGNSQTHQGATAAAAAAPVLTEEISDYRKHEVYEEKGFKDSAYDHRSYKSDHHDHADYNQVPEPGEGDNGNNYQSSPSSHTPKRQKNPQHQRLHSDGTSTDILKYAESNLYDADAHRMGIYKARAGIHCPEVIDFNLDPEGGTLGSKKNPKLQGLGSKISCLKNKYFGNEPLPSAIFPTPSESKVSLIKFGTMEDFMSEVHKSVKHGFGGFNEGGPQVGFMS